MSDHRETIRLLAVRKLQDAPADRGADDEWWEADLASGEERATIQLRVTGTVSIRVDEAWVREDVERLLGEYRTLTMLRELSPFELLPPPSK